jgi:hypothetical protein
VAKIGKGASALVRSPIATWKVALLKTASPRYDLLHQIRLRSNASGYLRLIIPHVFKPAACGSRAAGQGGSLVGL